MYSDYCRTEVFQCKDRWIISSGVKWNINYNVRESPKLRKLCIKVEIGCFCFGDDTKWSENNLLTLAIFPISNLLSIFFNWNNSKSHLLFLNWETRNCRAAWESTVLEENAIERKVLQNHFICFLVDLDFGKLHFTSIHAFDAKQDLSDIFKMKSVVQQT